mmetsp:Transcript_20570/g.57146  ORF Transcript_20570/g.57146 Transcript_20570/m.57146 type:complete len:268 (+) Transcript_20570:286-1089(+)
MPPLIHELVEHPCVGVLASKRRAEHLEAHPGRLVDDGRIVAEPPTSVHVQVAELPRDHAKLVLVACRQYCHEELHCGVSLAKLVEKTQVGYLNRVTGHDQSGISLSHRTDLYRDWQLFLLRHAHDHLREQVLAGRDRRRRGVTLRAGARNGRELEARWSARHQVNRSHALHPILDVLVTTLDGLLVRRSAQRNADCRPAAREERVHPQGRLQAGRDRRWRLAPCRWKPMLRLLRVEWNVRHHCVLQSGQPEHLLQIDLGILLGEPRS